MGKGEVIYVEKEKKNISRGTLAVYLPPPTHTQKREKQKQNKSRRRFYVCFSLQNCHHIHFQILNFFYS
jgi:hypothetical protein